MLGFLLEIPKAELLCEVTEVDGVLLTMLWEAVEACTTAELDIRIDDAASAVTVDTRVMLCIDVAVKELSWGVVIVEDADSIPPPTPMTAAELGVDEGLVIEDELVMGSVPVGSAVRP